MTTFAEEIQERKHNLMQARYLHGVETGSIIEALERRIDELGSDLDNAHEDLEREKALTKKLKVKLDGMVELVGELVSALETCTDHAQPNAFCEECDHVTCKALRALAKAKESMS